MRYFEYHHTVSFEETNLVGNVYFVNHLRWQGSAREHFLKQYAPEILQQLAAGLVLVTTRCSCEYLEELRAFDDVVIRMSLGNFSQNRITLRFEYSCDRNGTPHTVAVGEQQIACMVRREAGVVPTAVPRTLREALETFALLSNSPD